MIINLDPIFSNEGSLQEIKYNLDLSEENVYGSYPMKTPAEIKGKVFNNVGIVELEADVNVCLDAECDRCAKRFSFPFSAKVSHIIVRSLNDDDNDSFILADSSQLDLDSIVREDVLLPLPIKFLCSEDCKGLCPHCGKDLNEGPCSCKKEVDPRLAALQQLLEEQ